MRWRYTRCGGSATAAISATSPSTLPHTAGMPPAVWRVLVKAHERRNLAEYEGHLEPDERLFEDLVAATRTLRDAIDGLPTGDSEP